MNLSHRRDLVHTIRVRKPLHKSAGKCFVMRRNVADGMEAFVEREDTAQYVLPSGIEQEVKLH